MLLETPSTQQIEKSEYELLNSGKLKGYWNGRVWRVPKAALKEYIIENAKLK